PTGFHSPLTGISPPLAEMPRRRATPSRKVTWSGYTRAGDYDDARSRNDDGGGGGGRGLGRGECDGMAAGDGARDDRHGDQRPRRAVARSARPECALRPAGAPRQVSLKMGHRVDAWSAPGGAGSAAAPGIWSLSTKRQLWSSQMES